MDISDVMNKLELTTSFYFLVPALITAFAALFTLTNGKQNRTIEEVIKKMMLNNEKSDKENTIKQAISNIPTGINEEEFFKRLRKELLDISYLQIKNSHKDDNEDPVYFLLETHHQQALQQSNVQFWFSIIASIIGFVTIIISIFVLLNNNWYDYVFKSIPGIVLEAASVLFFNQARETRDRATKFFRELNYEKQIAKSVAIADTIDSEEVKSNVKSQIALRIIGINETE